MSVPRYALPVNLYTVTVTYQGQTHSVLTEGRGISEADRLADAKVQTHKTIPGETAEPEMYADWVHQN
jgi:hypothetical protein